MKYSVLNKRFVQATSLVSKIVSPNPNIPILSNILIRAKEDNLLVLESSNLEVSIRVRVPAKVEIPGVVTVPARKFADYLSTLAEETLQLQLEGNQFQVAAGQSKASFVTMPENEFPELPTQLEQERFALIDKQEFRSLVKRVVFAAASGDTHPVLTGILWDFEQAEGQTNVVSTDSFRLSKITLPSESNLQSSLIIPADTLSEVDGLLASELEGSKQQPQIRMDVGKDENQVFFSLGEVEVISRLLDASFPDYNTIFPTEFSTQIKVNRLRLLDELKTTAIFTTGEGQSVKLNLKPEQGKISLSARSAEIGSYNGQVDADIEGQEMTLGFNSRYLIEALSSFSDDSLLAHAAETDSPVLIESAEQNGSYQHVVMPMTLNE